MTDEEPAYEMSDANKIMDELLRWLAAGANVIIERDGVRVARLIPYVEQEPNAEISLHITEDEE